MFVQDALFSEALTANELLRKYGNMENRHGAMFSHSDRETKTIGTVSQDWWTETWGVISRNLWRDSTDDTLRVTCWLV